ncbi:MAG: LysR family transcriptional regulator [Roseibium sp.]|uniref:LysR substrate-binding domain-containing protein n=1 Tax=Roseibium sp. TaxID=1936156 RepID=UPI002628021F|nr:LysR substrate-binding domain-containing protein [Roseibium sp.]MCV0424891.1 LysR family transcriptional regulator [Roseibium sp.]
MRPNLPPLAAVRVFEAAARHKNFTKAATELGMTQAAVSYQIKILEERVGTPLFERRARGVSLSEVGRKFAAKASEALDILGDAFSDAKGKSQDSLSISAIPTFATNALAQRLGSFQLANPSISVRVEISEILVDFATGEFDVAIRGGRGNWDGLRSHLIVPTRFTPMLSHDLAESLGGVNTPEDLFKFPFISKSDPWWTVWLKVAGIHQNKSGGTQPQHFGPQILEAQAAIAGQGVAMLTPAFFKNALANGQLIQPFELECDDGTGYWLVYPESRRNSRTVRLFKDWLLQEFSDFRTPQPKSSFDESN